MTASRARTALPRPTGPTEALRVAVLGLNLWTIAIGLPTLHGGVRGALDVALLPVPLLALGLGALALPRPGERARAVAVGALLVGVPVALGLVLASRADLADRDAWGAPGLVAASISTLAFGAVAADACARPGMLRSATSAALASPLLPAEAPARTWLRRLVIGATTGGALLAAVLAPTLGSRATLVRAWGEAADEATVLASIVGTAAGAFALAAIVGPRLRAPRPGEIAPARPAVRVAVALTLAVLALAAWLTLRHADRPA